MDMLGIGRGDRRGKSDTPVAVLSRTFPVDSTLSDLWTFLRESIGQTSLGGEELMGIDAVVADALTKVEDDTKSVTVSLRVFPHSVEVDVLLSDAPPDPTGGTRVTQGLRHVSHRYQRRSPGHPGT